MGKIAATTLAFLGAVAAAGLIGRTHAQGSSASAASERAMAEGRFVQNEVLIQFGAGATDFDKQEARGWVNGQRKELIRGGAAGELELDALPVGIPLDNAIGVLMRHPSVAFAEPNWIYTHEDTSNDPYYTGNSLWGMYGDTTSPANQYGSQAGEAWAAGQTGSASVLVGVIDEGIDFSHPDLAANIWTNPFDPMDGVDNDGNGHIDDVHGWDFYQNNNSIFDGGPGSSVDAHGTHVSGTIGGVGGNGIGVAGVNWSVGIISAKFLGPSGGSTSNAVKAVDYITKLKTLHPTLNIVATNNSWGGGGYSQSLHDAIIRAAKAGILFDAAAGNSSANNDVTAFYPANYDTSVGTSTENAASFNGVIAVAAITSAGSLASFSDYGARQVHLGAPGASVVSTTPNNTYSSYSGTSMATPHVTGAAALYTSMNPGVSAATIRSAILASAQNTPTASLAGKTVTGGRLNIGWFLSGGTPPSPPSEPTGLGATAVSSSQIDLAWTDTSSDEDGFTIERCAGSGCTNFVQIVTVGANVTSYSNTALSEATTYVYRARAYKGGDFSGYSNTAQATTPSSGITLLTRGYKVKGVRNVDLTWSGAVAASVDVYRNSVRIVTTANDGAHRDVIAGKGAGTFTYKVCIAGTSTCSNNSAVTF